MYSSTVENKAFRLNELFFLLLVLPPSRLPDMAVPDFYPEIKKRHNLLMKNFARIKFQE
jgi:hypothetical protein